MPAAPLVSLRSRAWAALGCAFVAACSPGRTRAPAPAAPLQAAEFSESEQSQASAATESPAPAGLDDAALASVNAADGASAAGASADDGLDADIAALAASTRIEGEPGLAESTPVEGESEADLGPRNIVYRVTPGGLVVELDGLHLRPRAKSFRAKGGAFGVELTVTAESFDGRQYWLDMPAEGPLSIAGNIEGKDGKSTRFGDTRQVASGTSAAEAEDVVTAAEPREFKQRWPGKGQPKLWRGQTLTLEVGLWGMRPDTGRERPVRRLFVVKMYADTNARPVVTPPTLDWGS